MPLNTRSIAVSIAVTGFFAIAIIGWSSGLSPFTCCKRALLGAAAVYIAGVCAVKVINAILMSAIINHQIRRQQEENNAGRD